MGGASPPNHIHNSLNCTQRNRSVGALENNKHKWSLFSKSTIASHIQDATLPLTSTRLGDNMSSSYIS